MGLTVGFGKELLTSLMGRFWRAWIGLKLAPLLSLNAVMESKYISSKL